MLQPLKSCFSSTKQSQTNKANDVELEDRQCGTQPTTTVQASAELAVQISSAYKYYGSKKDPLLVLDGLIMTIPRGTIYALLGANGCGKTTLLRCILGLQKINSGEIRVLGKSVSTSGFDFGHQIGYMPQEVALYTDFTIQETLKYFGWIADLDNKQIEEKSELLTTLFTLPKTGQKINELSVGEQRRVSLAVTLLHDPELLILDEPTVGLDSLLRETLWKYFRTICSEKKTTIIVTTHYTEEARQADFVALLRNGKLLAEDSPNNLLEQYGTQELEDVFFKLSVAQDHEILNNSKCLRGIDDSSKMKKRIKLLDIKFNHIKALLGKNALWWMRNIPILIFMILLSVCILPTAFYAIGHDPRNLSVAVVNYETNNTVKCDRILACDSQQLSCSYLQYLKKRSVKLIYFDSEDDAQKSVFHGTTAASITFRSNYSLALRSRIDSWLFVKAWDVDYSNIYAVTADSDFIVSRTTRIYLFESFKDFIRDYFLACDINPQLLNLPINWDHPIYGSSTFKYAEFVLPGLLIVTIFTIGILLTAGVFFTEKQEVSLERILVMGVTEIEVLLGHIITESFLMVFQSSMATIISYGLLDTNHKGSFSLVLLLVTSVQFCGMSYGYIISCLCKTYMLVISLGMMAVLPSLFLNGVIWPIESMHYMLQYLVALMPLTKPIESLRSILHKNAGLFQSSVCMGFLVANLWSVIFVIATLLFLKFKRN